MTTGDAVASSEKVVEDMINTMVAVLHDEDVGDEHKRNWCTNETETAYEIQAEQKKRQSRRPPQPSLRKKTCWRQQLLRFRLSKTRSPRQTRWSMKPPRSGRLNTRSLLTPLPPLQQRYALLTRQLKEWR